MNLMLPLKFEVRAKASSTFTLENIESRLAVLAGRTDSQSIEERDYLVKLKARKFPES